MSVFNNCTCISNFEIKQYKFKILFKSNSLSNIYINSYFQCPLADIGKISVGKKIQILSHGFRNCNPLSEKPVLNGDCIESHSYKEKACFVTINRIYK